MKQRKRDVHVKFVIDMDGQRIRRWNLVGYLFSIVAIFAMLGLIIYGQGHKEQLEVVMSILTVILTVATFAIIRRNIKRICKSKIKNNE